MNKTGKNLLLVFTLLCMIALAIFVVELVLLNRDENGESGPAASGGPAEENGNGEDPGQGASDTEEPSGTGYEENGETPGFTDQPSDIPPPSGRRHVLALSENESLVIYADDDLFEFHDGEIEWRFTYTGGEPVVLGESQAILAVTLAFIDPDLGISAYAETFLVPYLDGGESTVIGEGQIRNSSLRGVFVTGEVGGETYEAWIRSLTGRTVLLLVINYQNYEQRQALYSVLDTLELLQHQMDAAEEDEPQ